MRLRQRQLRIRARRRAKQAKGDRIFVTYNEDRRSEVYHTKGDCGIISVVTSQPQGKLTHSKRSRIQALRLKPCAKCASAEREAWEKRHHRQAARQKAQNLRRKRA